MPTVRDPAPGPTVADLLARAERLEREAAALATPPRPVTAREWRIYTTALIDGYADGWADGWARAVQDRPDRVDVWDHAWSAGYRVGAVQMHQHAWRLLGTAHVRDLDTALRAATHTSRPRPVPTRPTHTTGTPK